MSVCLFAASMGGCKQNELNYFDESYSALNIWLGLADRPTDNLVYNFAYRHDMDEVTFYARITGKAVDYDRPFTLKAIAGHLDKVHVYTYDYVIPAGAYTANFPIRFGKPPFYSEFRYEDGYLVLKVESEHFAEGAKSGNNVNMDRLLFILLNGVTKPFNWDSDTSPYLSLTRYFGTYSDVKFEFIIQTLGISEFRSLYSSGYVDLSEYPDNVYTHVMMDYFALRCRAALATFNSNPENIALGLAPLIDEHGFPVTI
jgi:hypothetical protein